MLARWSNGPGALQADGRCQQSGQALSDSKHDAMAPPLPDSLVATSTRKVRISVKATGNGVVPRLHKMLRMHIGPAADAFDTSGEILKS